MYIVSPFLQLAGASALPHNSSCRTGKDGHGSCPWWHPLRMHCGGHPCSSCRNEQGLHSSLWPFAACHHIFCSVLVAHLREKLASPALFNLYFFNSKNKYYFNLCYYCHDYLSSWCGMRATILKRFRLAPVVCGIVAVQKLLLQFGQQYSKSSCAAALDI